MKPETSNAQYDKDDRYPSRGQQKARLIERADPVVYAPNSDSGPIDPRLIDQYRQRGFVVLDDLFSTRELQIFQSELERLRIEERDSGYPGVIREPGSGDLRSVFAVHTISPVYRELARDPRLVALARYLLDDDVYIHQSRVNYKPGFRGKPFYWHSDFETWHVEDGMPSMRAVSMSISLTENRDDNGPLMLIPGSHKTYVVCEGETPAQHFRSSLQQQEFGIPDDASLTQLAEQGGIVTATARPGSAIVFDCNTMHGSNSNITPFPRSNVFFVYNAMGNRVGKPYCEQPPRPEYLCTRDAIEPLVSTAPGEWNKAH